jgi:hypothetical protein
LRRYHAAAFAGGNKFSSGTVLGGVTTAGTVTNGATQSMGNLERRTLKGATIAGAFTEFAVIGSGEVTGTLSDATSSSAMVTG